MITMVIDHSAIAFFNGNSIMRAIGRIAFPLYAFMFAEGFRHYKSDSRRVSKHMLKLIILAAVSEFAYDFYKYGLDTSQYMSHQSNIITLLLAYFGLMATEKYKGKPLAIIIIYFITAFISIAVNSNYILVGVFLVYAFYWYLMLVMNPDTSSAVTYKLNSSGFLEYNFIKRYFLVLLILLIYLPFYFLISSNFQLGEMYLYVVKVLSPRYIVFFLVAFLIASYNGHQGYSKRWFKLLYFWFYPLHLFVIGLIEQLIK